MFLIPYKKRLVYTVKGNANWAVVKLCEHLVSGLERKGARKVAIDNECIRFTEGLGKFMLPILDGKIMLHCHNDRLEVAYQISFIKVYLMSLLIMGLAVPVFFPYPNALEILIWLFCFAVLMGAVGIILTVNDFNYFMKDCLREFFNSASSFGVYGELITSR